MFTMSCTHLKIFGYNFTFPETVEPYEVEPSTLMDPRGWKFVVTGAHLCVCVFVCVPVSMYIHTHTHTHTHKHDDTDTILNRRHRGSHV